MTEHPEHLLAEYVDGTLTRDERAVVEAHLSDCDRCRGEVELSREAVLELAAASPVQAPLGLTREIARRARGPRLWQRPAAWAAAGAAAVVLAGGIFLSARESEVPLAAPEQGVAERAPDDAAAPPSGAQVASGEALSEVGYPAIRASEEDHTPATLAVHARELASETRAALDAGFPPSATSFYSRVDLRSVDPPIAEALRCASSGTPPDRAAVPFVIETVRFRGIPAYLVSFLRGEGPDAPYDQVQLLVVDRGSCALRHFSRQRL